MKKVKEEDILRIEPTQKQNDPPSCTKSVKEAKKGWKNEKRPEKGPAFGAKTKEMKFLQRSLKYKKPKRPLSEEEKERSRCGKCNPSLKKLLGRCPGETKE